MPGLVDPSSMVTVGFMASVERRRTDARTGVPARRRVLDPTGEILRASLPATKLGLRTVSLAPIEAFLSTSATFPIRGDNPRVDGRPKVFSVARMPAEGPLEGYLYIVLSDELHDSVAAMVASSTIVRLGVWVGLAGLALIFVAGILIFTLFTSRLKRLAAVMTHFQESDFMGDTLPSAPIHGSGDEVVGLEQVFHDMAARMAEQVGALKENDRLRSELVANVSHDLRTPLTALQGYLETMQLETASEAEKRTYLAIATKHSVRLGKLVGELFELAKFDTNTAQLHKEAFGLAELVQDVVGEFQLAARQRGVALSADIELRPFVHADVGLLERVLENLLDNALQHTPPGGTVTVILKEQEGGSVVEVTDTGSGIPTAELPHVFERYYRASRTDDGATTGAGLGLAISKRMLELHGVELKATSQVGVGSMFWFAFDAVAPSKGV